MEAEDERRRAAVTAGYTGDVGTLRALLRDPAPKVRASALGGLVRAAAVTADDVRGALDDPSPLVRRRACEEAARIAGVDLVPVLADPDPLVVEAACWALGEREAADSATVAAIAAVATGHDDALAREAAVAALGAIGDERGLPAILAATADKPAVRRRAILALAPFEGPDVEAALERALEDRDWQVRQAAEDLTGR
ncbi:MAG TPA: HEAT repeat domain-containing protein [Acidimicrobiales bacterium]|nr:HEAT repeat domain-containing protein [Acidimicrobiales bacterium]